MSNEICGECMVTDEHDSVHYTSDEWHYLGHCTGCNPNVDSYAAQRREEEEVESNPPSEEESAVDIVTPQDPINAANLQVRGIHLKGTGMSFILGEGNVTGIDIAQNPDTGVMLVRVKFKGTRKARVFEVTPMDFITELAERSPLVIASSL